MNETLNVGLTKDQREVLLRGLRYVRSSLMLEIADPTPDHVKQRNDQLRAVSSLVEQLSDAPTGKTASV